MTMHITYQHYTLLHVHLFGQFLSEVNGWVQCFRGIFPPSVQVTTCKTASLVAIYDAVWVEHWHQFENVVVSKDLSFW